MNIAIITSGFLPIPATKGGAVENLIQNLLNENEKQNKFSTTIFTIYDFKAEEISKQYTNSKFRFIKVNKIVTLIDKMIFFIAKNIIKKENSHSYKYIFQRICFLRKVSKILKKEDFDKILLENHPTQYLALKWNKNNEKYANRYYYHCHNEFPGTYGCESIIRDTKKIICVSEYIASTLQKSLNMPKEKFTVLRNGIDIKRFDKELSLEEKNKLRKKYNIQKEDTILLFTGRIIPEKGVKELIEALEYVHSSNYKLLILGAALNNIETQTNYELKLKEQIEKVKNKVIFTGFVNYEKIYRYYKLADIAVLPSIWDDPAPLTIIESLVCGLPIITTNSGGIPEYAINGSSIILQRDDELVKNLGNAINELIQNDSKRKEMSSIARDISKELTSEIYYKNFIINIKD